MNELQKLIEKWDEQIALHRRVCEDPLMYTKEDRLKNSHYAQAICAVVADLKKLTIPAVSGSLQINWDDVYKEANYRSPTAFDEYVKSICNDR
jgi:hypothetical protein